MSTTATHDGDVWVEGYTTRDGVHVSGHWRKRTPGTGGDQGSGGDIPAAAAASPGRDSRPAPDARPMDVFGTSVGDQFTRDGKTYEAVRITPAGAGGRGAATGPVVHLKAVVDGQVQPPGQGATYDVSKDSISNPSSSFTRAEKSTPSAVERGLIALRKRQQTLSNSVASGGGNKCASCGEFAGDHHVCSAGTTTAPYQPAEVAEHRATIDRQHEKIFGEQRALDGLRPDIVWGEEAGADVAITQTRERVNPYADPLPEPPGYITITPPGRNRYKHEQMYAWPRRERPEDIFGPGSTAAEYDTYEEAAQAAAEAAAAARHGARRCGDCGRYVPIEGEHSCPDGAAAEQETTSSDGEPPYDVVTVDGVKVAETRHVDLGESAGADRCPRCGQYAGDGHRCPTPEGLPAGDYGGMKKDERVEAMLGDLEEAVGAVMESGQLTAWLDSMASNGMHRWSANNRMLAALQMYQRGTPPEDLARLHLMGFRQWEKYDRKVNKGSKAVWILAPITRKFVEEDENGNEKESRRVVGFKGVPVFDVSDTNGKPLPEPPIKPAAGEVTPGTIEGLRSRVTEAGYSYEETEIPDCRPETGEGTLGFTEPATKRIVVDSRLSSAQKASTIAHELGHVHCGHVDGDYSEYKRHRGRMETEAEAVAFLVTRSRGATPEQSNSFSPGYIASWSKGDKKVMHAAFDKAVRAHQKIMDGNWPSGGTR